MPLNWPGPLRSFRIYFSGCAPSDHLDFHVAKVLEPMRLIYHLELIAGGADILVSYDSSIYLYAAMALVFWGHGLLNRRSHVRFMPGHQKFHYRTVNARRTPGRGLRALVFLLTR